MSLQECIRGLALLLSSGAILAQSGAPVVPEGGVVNAADYSAQTSPGMIIAIYGTGFAAKITVASSYPLPATLDGVSVEVIDGARTLTAPLYFVSAGQVNAQLPYGLSGSTVQVRVKNAAGTSRTNTLPVAAQAPRLLTNPPNGKGEAILLHADYTLVTSKAPAKPNEVVILYLAGLGPVNPAIDAGRAAGDGGAGGALNRITGSIQALVNGSTSEVYYAGLAPYFSGLYQVNLKMPAAMVEGANQIVIRSGAQQSQAGITFPGTSRTEPSMKPEEVVKAALEAQARGDVDGMLSYCTMDFHSTKAAEATRKVLLMVRSKTSFRDLTVRHRATSYATNNMSALVRGEVSAMATINGVERPLNNGFLAFVARRGDFWKVVSIHPDDALNQEIYLRSVAQGVGKSSAPKAELDDISGVNNRADYIINKRQFNGEKVVLEGSFTIIGAIPVVGDAPALIYQGLSTLWEAKELAEEYWRYGRSPIFMLKMQQVMAGGVQIATEALPGFDTAADIYAGGLDQQVYWEDLKRAAYELKSALVRGELPLEARFVLPPLSFDVPVGLVIEEEAGTRTYGNAVSRVLIRELIPGSRMPFRVVGELSIAGGSPLESVAQKLGAVRRGPDYYIGFDLTNLADVSQPQDPSKEDPIFWKPQVESKAGGGMAVSWEVNCRRGIQKLTIPLLSGGIAQGPFVDAEVLNKINTLELSGADNTRIPLGVGQRVTNIKVLGSDGGFGSKLELTGCPAESLEIGTGDARIAAVERGKSITLVGAGEGTTPLVLRLPGSLPNAGVPELRKEIPIEVKAGIVDYLRAGQWLVSTRLAANLSCTSVATKVEGLCTAEGASFGFQFSNIDYDVSPTTVKWPVKWDGATFTVTAKDGASDSKSFDITLSATVSPDGAKLLNGIYRYTWYDKSSPPLQREVVTHEFRFSELLLGGKTSPAVVGRTSYTWNASGAAATQAAVGDSIVVTRTKNGAVISQFSSVFYKDTSLDSFLVVSLSAAR